MFKVGDKILVVRLETTVRQSTIKELAQGAGAWITSKPVMVEHKATIGRLEKVLIPVLFPDGSIHQKPYPDLTFGKGNKVSWKAKKPDHILMVEHKETTLRGKSYIARGKIHPSFSTQHIPVILNGKSVMIPLDQVVFKEKN